MSKAEDRAYECFPNEDIESKKARFGFLLGYHQAEKDLELTWKDIADILDVTDIIANDDSMEERLKTMSEMLSNIQYWVSSRYDII